jgi:MFS family permease
MKHTTKKQAKGKTVERPSQTLYSKIEGFFERNQQVFFVISMMLSALVSILLFDVKVSLSGDDCDYLIGADDFWHHFTFPTGHGALYPMVISPLVGIFGMKLILIKSLSTVFVLLSIGLLYTGIRGKVPAIVLIPTLLLVSICSYVFFYASHTYSEPLFMLMQGLLVYFFSKYFLGKDDVSYKLKTDWRKYFILAGLALCMTLTRSIGYGVIGVFILFFVIERRWKDLLYIIAASIIVFVLFQILKSVLWPGIGEAYDIKNYLAKDYFNPNAGMEDLPGLWKRFAENSMTFLSVFLYQFMGLYPETPSSIIPINPGRTILVYLIFAVCLTVLFKRNKTLLFAGLYVGVMCFFSFVLLQSSWGQDRIIVVYYPFILLFILGGFCYLFQIKALRKAFFIYPLLLAVTGYGTFSITKNRIERNIPVLQENLLGNPLYGLTPDWENFIRGSQWAAKNLDKNAVIVSRKPTISKVYTGRDFVGMYGALTVPVETLDSLKNHDSDHTVMVMDISKRALQGEPVKYVVNFNNLILINGAQASAVCIYLMPNMHMAETIRSLDENDLKYTLDYDGFVDQCKRMESIRVYDPEMMFRYLQDNRIDYLLLPQLRMDPTRNSGVFINTVHRFYWYISYKYPGRFRTVHTVGTEEPCEIIEFIH